MADIGDTKHEELRQMILDAAKERMLSDYALAKLVHPHMSRQALHKFLRQGASIRSENLVRLMIVLDIGFTRKPFVFKPSDTTDGLGGATLHDLFSINAKAKKSTTKAKGKK